MEAYDVATYIPVDEVHESALTNHVLVFPRDNRAQAGRRPGCKGGLKPRVVQRS